MISNMFVCTSSKMFGWSCFVCENAFKVNKILFSNHNTIFVFILNLLLRKYYIRKRIQTYQTHQTCSISDFRVNSANILYNRTKRCLCMLCTRSKMLPALPSYDGTIKRDWSLKTGQQKYIFSRFFSHFIFFIHLFFHFTYLFQPS